MGEVKVRFDHKDMHDTAVLLLAEAEKSGQDASVVRSADRTFYVPQELADAAGVDYEGKDSKAKSTAKKSTAKKKAPAKKAPAKKTAAKKAPAKKATAKKAAAPSTGSGQDKE